MKKQKGLSSATQYHLLPSNQETNALLAIAATNHDLPRLNALAQIINERHRASQDHDTKILDNALIMGSSFNEAKAMLKGQKGIFSQWCRINVSVNDTQRRIYQRLDRNRNLITDQINTDGVVLSIKAALRLITQKLKKGKPPTNNLIRCAILPIGKVEVSKNTKHYCLIFKTPKRQAIADAYKTITGSDLPPDPPDKKPAEEESLTAYIEIDAIMQETELQA